MTFPEVYDNIIPLPLFTAEELYFAEGKIYLQPDTWQMISIPILTNNIGNVAKVQEYIVNKIETITGQPCSNFIEVITTRTGDNDKWKSFIPNFTHPESDDNFPLIHIDSENTQAREVTAMMIKTKDYSNLYNEQLILDWVIEVGDD